jgi:hypothetical protein
VPACERWIRDFVKISEQVREKDLRNIVFYVMSTEGDKRKDMADRFILDF